MSPLVALGVITWIAIVVLYLGLAAVLREVRMLRAQVMRQAVVVPATATDADPGITLPQVVREGAPAVVVAADSTCPLCRLTIARLGDHAAGWAEPPVLLTYEPEQAWGPLPEGLRVVRDDDAWSQVAHLTPPVLLRVDGTGTAHDVVLPNNEADVDTTLTSWGLPTAPHAKETNR